MRLSDANGAQAAELAALHRAARHAAMPWLPVLHTPEDDIWFFKNIVLARQLVRVAQLEDRIAGFAAVQDGWLHHLYVRPGMWRRGVGARLLESVRSGLSSLELWTFRRNHGARRFYRKHGFEDVEFTDGSGNEEREPDVRMLWQGER